MKNQDIKNHFAYLGHKAKDKVTGFEGVVTTLSFDLYGCIQVVLTPSVDNKDQDSKWFDIARLEVLSYEPVMEVPNYDNGYVTTGQKGCALKSVPK